MRWSQRTMPLVLAMLSMVCAAACGGVTDANRAPVEAIDISPAALQLSAGASGALDAQVRDADGNVLTDRRIVWASSDPAVATVSDRGVVTAVHPGRADIAATAEGKTGVAAVTVLALPPQVASVRITPDRLDLYVAQTAGLRATAYDSRGAVVEGRAVVWMTNNVAVAAVSQSGGVTGLLPGTAVITAVIDGRSATATVSVSLMPVARVTVTPANPHIDAGKSVTLIARVLDATGNVLTGRDVSWTSSDTRIVTVDQSGVVRGIRRGSAVVTATAEGKFGTATVAVD